VTNIPQSALSVLRHPVHVKLSVIYRLCCSPPPLIPTELFVRGFVKVARLSDKAPIIGLLKSQPLAAWNVTFAPSWATVWASFWITSFHWCTCKINIGLLFASVGQHDFITTWQPWSSVICNKTPVAESESNVFSARKTVRCAGASNTRVVTCNQSSVRTPWTVPFSCGSFVTYYTVSQKPSHFCFLNSSVKHWPILIVFGAQHCEKHDEKWLQFCPSDLNTVAIQPSEIQKLLFGCLQ